MLTELAMFRRYVRAARQYFSETTTLEQATRMLSEGVRQREASLLATVREGIWNRPSSPYLPLFRRAGIEWGDVEALVWREGVDGALRELHRAGVYVTLDEFKGRRPIQRAGLEYAVHADDFDSPLLNAHFEGLTGGSGGVRRRLLVDLGLIAHDAAAFLVVAHALQVTNFRFATWRAVPPNNSGLKKPLVGARIGLGVDRWFSELPTRWGPAGFKYAAFTAFTVAAARWAGRPFPYPEHVPRDRVGVIVRWMAEMAAAGTPVYMDCAASAAVRICGAANESGYNIAGSVFRAGSEPLTRARAALITRTGARVVGGYATSETGPIAMACAAASEPDDVHVLRDKMAAIHAAPDRAEPGREGVLYLTTIFPSCPKILLNVDTGDSGTLERRDCGCALGKLGFDLHLRNIHSQEKLTSEGILLPASEVLRLMEEALPAVFGGTPADYQLVERGRDGIPSVQIVVSPRVGPLDEAEVIREFLKAVSAPGPGGRLMAQQLGQAGTLSVARCEPFRSPIGKMVPFYVAPKE